MDHMMAMLAARTLVKARRSGQRIEALPDGAVPASEADAYHVQDTVAAFHGERVGAWKVGATHPNAQAGLGVSGPVASRLFAAALLQGDQDLRDDFVIRGVEAEYAFLLGEDLPPQGAPYSRDAVRGGGGSRSTRPSRWWTPGSRRRSAGPLAVADNVNDAWWTCGEGDDRTGRSLDIVNAPVNMHINGEVVVEGSGAEVLGDPMVSLHVAGERARIGP